MSDFCDYMKLLIEVDFENLDLGTREYSRYIDFICSKSLGINNVMKGKDNQDRSFYVFKAEIIFDDGRKSPRFTTVFQRYNDCESLWVACGHEGLKLFTTCGGMSEVQKELLYTLLTTGFVDLSNKKKEEIDEYDLLWRNDIKSNYKINKNIYPTSIKLGY